MSGQGDIALRLTNEEILVAKWMQFSETQNNKKDSRGQMWSKYIMYDYSKVNNKVIIMHNLYIY